MEELRSARNALAAEVGAEGPVHSHSVVGFVFGGDTPPEGWSEAGRVEGRPYFAPSRRTKAGRALHGRMAAIRTLTGREFGQAFGHHGVLVGGNRILFMAFEPLGDALVIAVPRGDGDGEGLVPPDAAPLKMSEYWAMKEAATRTAAARPFSVLFSVL
jgi:hypothetical protein